VVIAKYYEGAKINGSIIFNGAPYQCDLVVQKNVTYFGTTFGIDHDMVSTDENGSFSLLAPAGDIIIQLRRNTELGANAFVMKTVYFNSSDDLLYSPITDDEAMRKTDFIRELGNITVDPATISGYVYDNFDNDSATYNASSDQPINNVEVSILEIAEFDEQGQPISIGNFKELATNTEGVYSLSNLIPGIYVVRAAIDDFVIHENFLFATSGNNSYDIVNPKPADVNGVAYVDTNANNEYDSGEEIDDVTIELLYTTLEGTTNSVDMMRTGNNGVFEFNQIIPGNYIINATKLNISTGHLNYATEESITLEEDKTTNVNISLAIAPIEISGETLYQDSSIGGIRMTFSPDTSVENNTAVSVSETSSSEGEYTLFIQPGVYNVTVDYTATEGIFIFNGKITTKMGEGKHTYDIDMIKKSITVTGTTQYNSITKENITITFTPDTTIENNTALFKTVISDETGNYRAELSPGFYAIQIDETLSENGQNITYIFSGELELTATTPPFSYDITMTREQ
jgi:hypothetical protein